MEISGGKTLELAKIAETISKSFKVEIILAPPQASLFHITKSVKIPVISQHVDNEKVGSTTGFFIPELAKSYGVVGSLINHSEHRLDHKIIKQLIDRLRKLDMLSIVCASDVLEVGMLSKFNPDMIAIEPPELIGTGQAVSKVNPAIIRDSVTEAKKYSELKVICGAGIVDKSDVISAIKLGSQGILIASGIIKARSWREKLSELVQPFR